MNHSEQNTPSGRPLVTAALLLCTAALAVLFALLPAQQTKERSAGRFNLADEYHSAMAERLALIPLSDTKEAAPQKASTEPAPQTPSEEPVSAPAESKQTVPPWEPEETIPPATQPEESSVAV